MWRHLDWYPREIGPIWVDLQGDTRTLCVPIITNASGGRQRTEYVFQVVWRDAAGCECLLLIATH